MKMFKTSMGGFNKKDVNRYIIESDREYSEAKALYEEKIARLTEELSAARAELDEAKVKLSSAIEAEDKLKVLQGELELSNEREAELADSLGSKYDEVKSLNDTISSINAKHDSLVNENSELRGKLTATETSVSALMEEKAALECKLSSANDEITRLNQANENAASAVAELVDLKEKLKTNECENKIITEKAQSASDELHNIAGSTVDSLRETIFEGTDSCLKDFRQYADKLLFNSKTMLNEMAKEYSEMAGRAALYCDSMERSASDSLGEFKTKTKAICDELNSLKG